MDKKTIGIALCIGLILVGCSANQDVQTTELGIGSSCTSADECMLPMEFAIQSNCPFASVCIDSKCAVVCPLYAHDPNPEISESYAKACEKNDDCDCAERNGRSLECLCHGNKCVSVEAR